MRWVVTPLRWGAVFAIAAFYLASSAGWFMVLYAAATGLLDQSGARGVELGDALRGLTVLDHVVRCLQVLAISAASILMVLGRRAARQLVVVCLIAAVGTTLVYPKWSVSFLSGLGGITLLGIVAAFLYALERNRPLRQENGGLRLLSANSRG